MFKRTILVLSLALIVGPSLFAQKFTKREQARKEAREAYYFCGASFTFTAGFVHSWMSNSLVSNTNSYKGFSERWGNTDNSFDLGFAWDQAFDKHWGLQTGIYYMRKGGDHLYYYDNGLGYGAILRPEETEEGTAQSAELQCQGRYFVNLTKRQRLSVNLGVYIEKLFKKPSGFGNWNMGPQIGLGYDLEHWSFSATYQPGVFESYVSDCNTHQSALVFNIGYRIWKK